LHGRLELGCEFKAIGIGVDSIPFASRFEQVAATFLTESTFYFGPAAAPAPAALAPPEAELFSTVPVISTW
jgi:hypothetical protein